MQLSGPVAPLLISFLLMYQGKQRKTTKVFWEYQADVSILSLSLSCSLPICFSVSFFFSVILSLNKEVTKSEKWLIINVLCFKRGISRGYESITTFQSRLFISCITQEDKMASWMRQILKIITECSVSLLIILVKFCSLNWETE